MSTAPSPVEPVEDWEKVREEWVASLDNLFREAEAWAETQGWATLRETLWLEEGNLGRYEAWRLLVHAPEGRVVFTPVARYVGWASGLIDIDVLPSFDPMLLVRHDDRHWRFHAFQDTDQSWPWSEDSYIETMKDLFASARRR